MECIRLGGWRCNYFFHSEHFFHYGYDVYHKSNIISIKLNINRIIITVSYENNILQLSRYMIIA